MRKELEGGGWNPSGQLLGPVPSDPVPTTFDAALNMASWLSLGHWALVALDKADGSFDFQAKVEQWLVGDWEHVAVSAAAMRDLQGYCNEMADAVDFHAVLLDQFWDGTAAQAAQVSFVSQTSAFRLAADRLEIAAKGYDDVASGLYGVAKDVGNLIESLIGLLISTGISLAATAAGSVTLVIGALGAAATYYNITQIVSSIQKIVALIEGAMTLVDTFTDVVLGALGSAGDWHPVTIPGPYDNNVVTG